MIESNRDMTEPVDTAPESSHNTRELLKHSDRFPDLRNAGRALALQLEAHRATAQAIVLGIALGGVPVAHEVAMHLDLSLDLVLVRRLLAPEGPASQICAMNVAGLTIIDDRIKVESRATTPLEHFLAQSISELEERERTCRRGRPPVDLEERTVILVDCGIRTGSTIDAAISAIRRLRPRKLVAAVPVTSTEGAQLAEKLADEFVYLAKPQTFINAGFWYRNFQRPGDQEVGDLL